MECDIRNTCSLSSGNTINVGLFVTEKGCVMYSNGHFRKPESTVFIKPLTEFALLKKRTEENVTV